MQATVPDALSAQASCQRFLPSAEVFSRFLKARLCENAAILAGGTIGTHLQMGIGDGIIPDILNKNIYDDIYIVTDEEAIQTAKDLASKEGIMCGISSGTNVAAALKLAEKLGEGKTVVTILPDTAERYFSTPLFDL